MSQPNEDDPLSYQVGGSHYSRYEYQPIEFFNDLRLDFNRANALKYLARWKQKNGIEDLKKAQQYLRFFEQEHEKAIDKCEKFLRQFDGMEKMIMEDILDGSIAEAREYIQELIEIEEANIEAEEGDNESNSDN